MPSFVRKTLDMKVLYPQQDFTFRFSISHLEYHLFCAKTNLDRNEYVNTSIYTDMLPLHFHIIALVHFSEGALNGAKEGVISGPDMTLELDYDELQEYLENSYKRIKMLNSNDINALVDGEVLFNYNEMILPFRTEDFFLTYALPHFYFRASIIYSILRSRGVPVGIADFIGIVKTTPSSRVSSEQHQYTGEEYLHFLEQLANS